MLVEIQEPFIKFGLEEIIERQVLHANVSLEGEAPRECVELRRTLE